MFQKVSENQLFLFEVWGNKGFIAPAPAAFSDSKESWSVKGNLNGKKFSVLVTAQDLGEELPGKEIPLSVSDNFEFEMTCTQGELLDSIKGTVKFL
jgi:hypothetical protein